MMIKTMKGRGRVLLVSILLLMLWVLPAQAVVEGLTGSTFNLTAKADHITTGEGNSVMFWGYANGAARAQYPGPTLIVNQGDTVTINLTNVLPQAVSMVFPGHNVSAFGGTAGLITQEAPGDGVTTVRYTFVAGEPGTYTYYSGTNMDLQIEMGLLGALIVRPTGFDINSPGTFQAYNHADSAYDHEYLYLITEMDPVIHEMVELEDYASIDTTAFAPTYWFVNGRNFPDTVSPAGSPLLPTQPYNSFIMMHPGDQVLIRWVGAGRDTHPIHLHGNNFSVIAKDGRLLSSNAPDLATAGADLAYSRYTQNVFPGETVDAIFGWTGYKLGWDMYGHAPGDPLEPNEYPDDHGKPLPVAMPESGTFTGGAMFSGSPFLGGSEFLPPGEGSLNTFGGYFYVWHSHHEKEIINNDIFIGGMLALMVVAPHSVPIPTTPAL